MEIHETQSKNRPISQHDLLLIINAMNITSSPIQRTWLLMHGETVIHIDKSTYVKAGDRTAAAKIKMRSKRRLCGKSMAISTYLGVTLKHRCGNRYLRWIREAKHLWSFVESAESEVRAGCVGWDERMTVKRRGIKRGRGNTASSGCFQTNDREQPSITRCFVQLTDKPLNITLVNALVTTNILPVRDI